MSAALDDDAAPAPSFRPSNSLPYNLVERIRVSIEENLNTQALELLNAVIFAGISNPDECTPALMPPSTHLRFLLTLMVHPYYTTQQHADASKSDVPTTAYLLMRRIIRVIGPMGANLGEVWKFDKGMRSGKKALRRHEDKETSPTGDEHLSGELANAESLFSRIDDVWNVVGWAFTCSVSHPTRWPYYKNVLECLLLTLEEDWDDRWRSYEKSKGKKATNLLKGSLIINLLPDTTSTFMYRRVINSILATGTEQFGQKKNAFERIWDDELLKRRPKKKGHRNFDSFIGEEDGSEDEMTKPLELDENDNPIATQSDVDVEMEDVETEPSVVDEWGGMESVLLRQRFLALLSKITFHGQFIKMEQLFREYSDNFLHFPLPSFKLFATTLLPHDMGYQCALNKFMLEVLISSKAPKSEQGDDNTNQEVICRRFLPYSARTMSILDNAKIAILLEVLLRILLREGYLSWYQEFEDLVEQGITARQKKVTSKGKEHQRLKEDRDVVKRHWSQAEEGLRLIVRITKARD